MKLLIGFIAATLPAYHALAETVDWKNVSSNKRVCTKVNDGGNVCKTSAELKCTFTDVNGVLRSCLAEDNTTPFFHVSSSQCGVVQATIEMKVCNLNSDKDHWIQPWTGSNNFLFKKTQVLPNPDRFKRLNPGQCRIVKTVQALDTCVKTHPMSVELEGNMPDLQGNSHCRCYLWRQSRVNVYDDVNPVSSSLTNTCTSSTCNADVSISCEYSENGQTKSCMSNGAEQPFIQLQEEECKNIEATINMEMCNRNQLSFIPWKPSDNKPGYEQFSFFKFKGSFYETPISTNIASSSCRSWTATQNLDTCNRKAWPMSVKFEGSLSNGNYCYCYLFHMTYASVWPEPPVAELDNTLIITEVLDGTSGNKFVELYAPDVRLRDKAITDDLYLCKMTAQGPIWSSAVPLVNSKVDSNGFIVLCNQAGVYSGCKTVTDSVSIFTDSNYGCMDMAIVKGGALEYEIVDSYGIVGSGCDNGDVSRFTGGRSERLPSFASPENPWVKSHWSISTPAGITDSSPGVWGSGNGGTPAGEATQIMITELTDPNGEPENRYIELYSPNRQSYEILENYWVVLKGTPDYSYPLKGTRLGSDGFLLLCRSRTFWTETQCDHELGPNSVADNNGCQVVIIYSGGDGTNFDTADIVDVYGIGNSCAGDFQGGIIERLESVNTPNPVFRSQEWIVTKPASKSQCTPRRRKVSAPTPLAPAPAPTKMPSNKNKNKNKNKDTSSSGSDGIIDPFGTAPSASPGSVNGKGAKSSKSSKASTVQTENVSSLLTSESSVGSSAASLSTMFGTLVVAGIGGWLCLW